MITNISEHLTDKIFPLSHKKHPGGKYARDASGAKGQHTYWPVYESALSPEQRAGILTTHYRIFWFLNFGILLLQHNPLQAPCILCPSSRHPEGIAAPGTHSKADALAPAVARSHKAPLSDALGTCLLRASMKL